LKPRWRPSGQHRSRARVRVWRWNAPPDEEHPELVLFTTLDIDREAANRCLREVGLSPLHNIRRVVRLQALPLLGTGKTDYRALKATLG